MVTNLFGTVGQNILLITSRILDDQRACNLLANPEKDCLRNPITYTEDQKVGLIDKHILFCSNIPENNNFSSAKMLIRFDRFRPNMGNLGYMIGTLSVHCLVPPEQWSLVGDFRIWRLASCVQEALDNSRFAGLGNLSWMDTDTYTLSEGSQVVVSRYNSVETR